MVWCQGDCECLPTQYKSHRSLRSTVRVEPIPRPRALIKTWQLSLALVAKELHTCLLGLDCTLQRRSHGGLLVFTLQLPLQVVEVIRFVRGAVVPESE